MKLIREKYEFIDKKTGEKKSAYNYKLYTDNGFVIMIKPSFKEGYKALFYNSVLEENE